jgi:hypothetical protein
MQISQKNTAALFGAALLLSSSAGNAANITVSDNNAGSRVGSTTYLETASGWDKGGALFDATQSQFDPLRAAKSEYQEVEPGMQTGSVWDLAAFVTPSTGKLGVVSAYNLGQGYGNTLIGDIMVKVGGTAANYADFSSANVNQAYNRYTKNTFGYQFAVKFDFSNLNSPTYSVFALDANTIMEDGEYAAGRNNGFYNAASQPWRLSTATYTSTQITQYGLSGGNNGYALAGYQNLALTYDTKKTGVGDNSLTAAQKLAKQTALDALVGFSVTSDYKYYAEIGTGFVDAFAASHPLLAPTVLYKLTMECGNDNMLGVDTINQNVAVPDGSATLSLLGLSFLSLVGLAKLRGRKVV